MRVVGVRFLALRRCWSFVHPWPDNSVDTLAVKGTTEALAEQANETGEPA